jgi:acyl-CoA reductase-like NAD-dependent aldehyde dehydrogenase
MGSMTTVTVTNPADGTVVGTTTEMTSEDVGAIARRLRANQPAWQALGPSGRGVWLNRFRDWLMDHEAQLTELIQLEAGKVRGDAAIETSYGAMVLNYYVEHAAAFLREEHPRPAHLSQLTKRLATVYHPHPLVGVISPWNWPLVMPMLDIPQALMAGCAVLSKPSEFAPLTWNECVRGWREDLGAPDVLACVTGGPGAGEAVIDNVDMVQFTGSVRTGRRVAARAGERLIPCSVELGGKDPMIVLADADLDRAAAGAVWGACVNAGQGCIAVERVYVEAPVYDAFVAKVTERMRELRQGVDREAPFAAEVGAMTTPAQLEIVERHVQQALDAGARALVGGHRPDGPGMFYPPTLLVDVDHSMTVMREETFGPVLPIMKVADADEALRLANDSSYGLSGSIWTRDRATGEALARRLEVGGVCINNVCMTNFQMPLPSGGWKASGLGARFGGAQGIRKYCRAQAIVSDRVEPKTEPHWYPFSPRKNGFLGRMSRAVEARDWRRRLGL